MILYAQNRMWRTDSSFAFKTELKEGKPEDKRYQQLMNEIELNLSDLGVASLKDFRNGELTISNRIEIDPESHDTSESIDIQINLDKTEKEMFDFRIPDWNLKHFLFRFYEFGYLNITSVFSVENSESLNEFEKFAVRINNRINDYINLIEGVFKYLEDKEFIAQGEYHFGLPKVLAKDTENRFETFLYGNHFFIGNESKSVMDQIRTITNLSLKGNRSKSIKHTPLNFNQFLVRCSPSVTLWETNSSFDFHDMLYCLHPDNILGAEQCASHSDRFVFKNLGELFYSDANFAKDVSSADMRKLVVHNHYIRQEVSRLFPYLSNIQAEYYNHYKTVFSDDLNYSYHDSSEDQKLIFEMIKERELEDSKKVDRDFEFILFLLAGTSLFSVITDVMSYIRPQGEFVDFTSLETVSLIISGALFVLMIFFLLSRKKSVLKKKMNK